MPVAPAVQELHQVPHSFVLSLLVELTPLLMAVLYAWRPSERRLALMRPLSLAAIFAALSGVVGGFAFVLKGIGTTSAFTIGTFNAIAVGVSQALVPAYVGFSCLAAAWLLVALGMRRGENR
jgi:small basic protein